MDYAQLQTMDTIFKSYFALDPASGLPISTGFTLTADGLGGLVWQSPVAALSTFGGSNGQPQLQNLPSYMTSTTTSLVNISTYITSTIMSTVNVLANNYAGFSPQISVAQNNSTVAGLGTAGYVSTANLFWFSTTLSTLVSKVSTLEFQTSTLLNFSTNYASSLSTTLSTYTGGILVPALGNIGTPPNGNPGNAFISSFTLTSSINTLSSIGYVQNVQLQSTVNSLGTVGYISTQTLQSTFNALSTLVKNFVTIENPANNVVVYNSQVTFTEPTTINYLSTLYLSTIPYTGTVSTTGTLIGSSNIVFSSLTINFAQFAPYIASNSRIFIDYYPTFLFSRLSENCIDIPMLTLSTFLLNGPSIVANVVPGTTHSAPFIPTNYKIIQTTNNNRTFDSYNIYNTPMRIQLSTGQILANSNVNLTFEHLIIGGYSIFGVNDNALATQNVIIRTSQTNSVFLTIFNPAYA